MDPIDYQREVNNALNQWDAMPWYKRLYWIVKGAWQERKADNGN